MVDSICDDNSDMRSLLYCNGDINVEYYSTVLAREWLFHNPRRRERLSPAHSSPGLIT